VEYFESNIPFQGNGSHFGTTFKLFLKQLKHKYFLFFCDDYLLIDKPNLNLLYDLFEAVKLYGIDYFSFGSNLQGGNFKKVELNYGFLKDCLFFENPEEFMYTFSVQPSIWNKDTIEPIFLNNPELSLHHFDTGCFKNKNGIYRQKEVLKDFWEPWKDKHSYNLKTIGCLTKSYDETDNYMNNHFIIPYVEIVRFGKFNTSYFTNTRTFLLDYLKQENVYDNEAYKKFL
jgi:hypothetical protein